MGVLQQIRGQRSLSLVHVTATVIRKVAHVIVRGGVSVTQAGLGRTAVKVLYIYTYITGSHLANLHAYLVQLSRTAWMSTYKHATIPHTLVHSVAAAHGYIPLISVLHYSVRRQLLYVSRQPCCQAGHSSEYHCCHCPPLHGAHCLHSPQEIDKQEDKEGSVSR